MCGWGTETADLKIADLSGETFLKRSAKTHFVSSSSGCFPLGSHSGFNTRGIDMPDIFFQTELSTMSHIDVLATSFGFL